jgi:flagellar motor switch protein FliM
MNDILSPDQIAELVAAAKSGEVPVRDHSQTRRPRRVRDIDFSRPTKLSPPDQKRFERAHASFCRSASLRLSTELRWQFELEVINSAQLTWASALRDVPQPSIVGLLGVGDGEHQIALFLEQSLILQMIELLIGGGDIEATINRPLTEIELALARRVYSSLGATLSIVWQDLLGLPLHLGNIESQTASDELVSPSEPTLVLTIEARDERGSSTISLLVPYSSIASASDRLSGRAADDVPVDKAASDAIRQVIGNVTVEVRAELGATELTIAELLALGTGDLVRLGPIGHEAVLLGDKRLNRIRPGRSGKRRAVQVLDRTEGPA